MKTYVLKKELKHKKKKRKKRKRKHPLNEKEHLQIINLRHIQIGKKKKNSYNLIMKNSKIQFDKLTNNQME